MWDSFCSPEFFVEERRKKNKKQLRKESGRKRKGRKEKEVKREEKKKEGNRKGGREKGGREGGRKEIGKEGKKEGWQRGRKNQNIRVLDLIHLHSWFNCKWCNYVLQ